MKNILSGSLNALIIVAMAFTGWQMASAQEADLIDREQNAEIYCMALNIYYEARSSSLADQAATADVVLNRVQDTRYPNTICGVVQQGPTKPSWKDPEVLYPVRHRCQFSWYCDGKSDEPKDEDNWVKAQTLAYNIVVNRDYRGISEGATHYHATYVKPKWSKDLQLIGRIGAHIYYRWENK